MKIVVREYLLEFLSWFTMKTSITGNSKLSQYSKVLNGAALRMSSQDTQMISEVLKTVTPASRITMYIIYCAK